MIIKRRFKDSDRASAWEVKYAVKGYILLMVLFSVLFFLWTFFWQNDERMLVVGVDLISLGGFVVPVVAFLYVIRRRSGTEKTFWIFMLAGQISYLVGEAIWDFYEVVLNIETPYPGWPDLFYLLCPVLFIIGLIYRNYMEKRKYISIRFALDIVLVMVMVSTLMIEFLITPIFFEADVAPLYIFVSVAYPITDLGLIFGAIYLWGDRSRLEMRPFYPMTVGMCLFLFADIQYLLLNSKYSYVSGNIVDLFWVLSLMLFGLSAILKGLPQAENSFSIESDQSSRIKEKSNLFYLPYFLISIILFIMVSSQAESKIVIGGCAIGIFLLMIRQNFTLLDNRNLMEGIKRLNEELVRVNLITEMDANTDYLTGLYNRRCIEGVMQKLIEQDKDENKGFSVIMIDVDWFKKINDNYGHEAGDLVLVKLAEILKRNMRPKEIVGRFGGEEFIGILPQTTIQEAESITERLRNEIEVHSFKVADIRLHITVSIGIAAYKEEVDEDKSSIIKRADLALYRAKNQGRNCTVAL